MSGPQFMTTGGVDIDASSVSSLVSNDEVGQQFQTGVREKEMSKMPPEMERQIGPRSQRRGQENSSQPRLQTQSPIHRTSASRFYDSLDVDSIDAEVLSRMSADFGLSKTQTKQSRRVPNWVLKGISSVLGISSEQRPCMATFCYTLTLFWAFSFSFFGVWFTVYDILSDNTKTTIHIGFVSIFLGFAYVCLGIYSHRLAARLFKNKNFAASVRIHSRTLFKINAAGLLIIVWIGYVALNLYDAYRSYSTGHCKEIGLFPVICHLMYASRVGITVVSTVWNLLVGCCLLSVCRTHTIGVRRFMRDLEEDARIYERYWRERLRLLRKSDFDTASVLDNSEWFVWDDNLSYATDIQTGMPFPSSPRHSSRQRHSDRQIGSSQNHDQTSTTPADQWQTHNVRTMHGSVEPDFDNSPNNFNRQTASMINQTSLDSVDPDCVFSGGDNQSVNGGQLPAEPPIMSSEELLLCYWKISNRMRLTSIYLQRWLASWAAFVIIWCADYVIYWLSHKADIWSILEFIIPVLLLFILCSAYAEANGEGQKMIRCICPTKERFGLLHFLFQQPLQMQVFGLSISYQAMLGIILAFAVAFASRLVLDEVL